MEARQCLTNLYQVGNTKGTRKITRFRRFFYQLHAGKRQPEISYSWTKALCPSFSIIYQNLPRNIRIIKKAVIPAKPEVGALGSGYPDISENTGFPSARE